MLIFHGIYKYISFVLVIIMVCCIIAVNIADGRSSVFIQSKGFARTADQLFDIGTANRASDIKTAKQVSGIQATDQVSDIQATDQTFDIRAVNRYSDIKALRTDEASQRETSVKKKDSEQDDIFDEELYKRQLDSLGDSSMLFAAFATQIATLLLLLLKGIRRGKFEETQFMAVIILMDYIHQADGKEACCHSLIAPCTA